LGMGMRVNNQKQNIPDFFDEFQGTMIKVATKFLEDGSYYVYKGILHRKGKDFIYLRDGEVIKIVSGKETERSKFVKIAINKAIISWVDFS
ncbi:MAG: hypothetical protein RMJ17_00735, partial [Candidatus Aenigmarchaeota archaeon]|nr:hypothetical protein [Candidatus Aenigmarchaeota archaeon]MDW8149114.1 hypothetical protein [Candidatus Aenigmarchaeota archaeon]